MFSRHVGSEWVKGGIYWSRRTGEFISVPQHGGRLEGGSEDRYFRTPLLAVLVAGPLMGLAFAIFLPASGMMVLVPYLLGKVRGTIPEASASSTHVTASRG